MNIESTDQEAMKAAENYANVKFAGISKIGHPMYTSENYASLEFRELKMAAFQAGVEWQKNRSDGYDQEALEKMIPSMINGSER